MQNMVFVGTGLEWASPFALSRGLSFVLGYGLLGAGWLALKAEGDVQAFGYDAIKRLLWMTLLAIAGVLRDNARTGSSGSGSMARAQCAVCTLHVLG
ncbi:hypothetical protein BZM27_55645, partial [Paraburkholderia steynii]